MQLSDYAFLFSRDRDTTLWQHAGTHQMMKTIDLPNGKYELYIFSIGRWDYQGEKTMSQIAKIASEM